MTRRFIDDHLPAPFFVYRTPLLPFDAVESWSAGLTGLPDRVAEETAIARDRLRRIVESPVIREAIFLASPDLDAGIDEWLQGGNDERLVRIERSVARYVCRMATRCTPFGLFASWSVGSVGEGLNLPVGSIPSAQRHTRLDMDFLVSLTDALGNDPAVRRAVSYRPNNSIARIAGKVRFAQSRLDGRRRLHNLVTVDDSEYLGAVLDRARRGARLDELVDAIAVDGITRDEGIAFVGELIDEQILVSDLTPAITGPEPLALLVEATRRIAPEVSAALEKAATELEALDREPLGASTQRYRQIAAQLVGTGVPVDIDRLFQVDMPRPIDGAVLDKELASEIADAIDIFHRITEVQTDTAIGRFSRAFTARYGDSEVPLLIALDDEIGVGFGGSSEISPLLEGIATVGDTTPDNTLVTRRTMVLIRRVQEVVARGENELRLTDADLAALALPDIPPLPDSFCVIASISQDGAGQRSILIERLSGPSGVFAMGRFTHSDARLRTHVEEHLRAEEAARPDAVFAEVVHLPEGRVGNIILRPRLRPFEIEFLGRGAADDDHQIALDDLLVSVDGERVILRSRRLGREVVPRLTNAHSFGPGALGVYRFLCLLQTQGLHGRYQWTWGPLLGAPFVPRVSYGRWTFARAQWLLDRRDIAKLDAASPEARMSAAAELRRRRRLPERVLLVEGDNELLVDFANPISVENFIQLLRRRQIARLTEIFPEPSQSPACGADGRYRAEIMLPFTRRSVAPQRVIRSAAAGPQSFQLGSEWLYAKIYCGNVTGDAVLRDTVAPLVSTLLRENVIDGWFFIRYSDAEGSHIRLRLHGAPRDLIDNVLTRLSAAIAPLLAANVVRKVVYDAYDRETARYGGDAAIAAAERLFRADSEAVLRLLKIYTGDSGLDARWRLCLRGIDMLFVDLGFDLESRLRIVTNTRKQFGRELDPEDALPDRLARKLRRERARIDCLFDEQRIPAELRPGMEILKLRSAEIHPIAERFHELQRLGLLTRPLDEIAGSLAHMFANRLLRSAHRMQELVIADFLERTYRSALARRKTAAPVSDAE